MTVKELIDALRKAAGETLGGEDARVHVAGGHYTANGQRIAVRASGEVVRIGTDQRAPVRE